VEPRKAESPEADDPALEAHAGLAGELDRQATTQPSPKQTLPAQPAGQVQYASAILRGAGGLRVAKTKRYSENNSDIPVPRRSPRVYDIYQLAVQYQWSRDVDDRLTPPDDSGHWFFINDRWTDWTLWRRLSLERAS
jgi:hypothetical protein